jgi:hypothetical protein
MYIVRKSLFLYCAGLIIAGWANAATEVSLAEPTAANSRVLEAMAHHGVWFSNSVYLRFYADQGLIDYLGSLTGVEEHDIAILPVFSSEPVHFRRGHLIFVSTGLILQAHDEVEFLRAVQSEMPTAGGSAQGFQALQARLATQIAQYLEATSPHLRRRP